MIPISTTPTKPVGDKEIVTNREERKQRWSTGNHKQLQRTDECVCECAAN